VLDQVHLQEAELSGFPAIQPDRDLMKEKTTGTRQASPALQVQYFPLVAQPAVDGGRGHALGLIGHGSGDGQLTEGPQAIHITEQEGFQSPSAGVVEDLPDLRQGSHHLAVVERLAFLPFLLSEQTARTDLADGVLAVLAGVGAVLIEDPGLLLAILGLTVPGS